MKKVFIYIILIIGLLAACENQPVKFDDYDFKAVYFPYQRPLRTLSLGEDRIDNSLDKEGKFDIGVSIGGMYEQNWQWTVDYALDNTLVDKVYTLTTPPNKILALPPAYYTLTPAGTVTIPKGSYNGLIRVQLADAFFDDTISLTGWYVIPLKLTATSADTILVGAPSAANPDLRILSHWLTNKSPKNWTLFGIKYVNAYHGTYLHRGRNIRTVTATGVPFDTTKFRTKYVENGLLIKMASIGRKKVISNGLANKTGGNYKMVLDFTNDTGASGAVTISSQPGAVLTVTGTGQYSDKASSTEKWIGITWQSMTLNYSWNEGIYTNTCTDTLVFRDRSLVFQENAIQVIP
jgi:hypothetical protein